MKLKVLFLLNCESSKYIAKLLSLSIYTHALKFQWEDAHVCPRSKMNHFHYFNTYCSSKINNSIPITPREVVIVVCQMKYAICKMMLSYFDYMPDYFAKSYTALMFWSNHCLC